MLLNTRPAEDKENEEEVVKDVALDELEREFGRVPWLVFPVEERLGATLLDLEAKGLMKRGEEEEPFSR